MAVWAAIRPSSCGGEVRPRAHVLELGAPALSRRASARLDLELGVGHLLDDTFFGEHAERAGLAVERACGYCRPTPIVFLRGRQQGGLQRLEEDLGRDPLLAADLLDRAA